MNHSKITKQEATSLFEEYKAKFIANGLIPEMEVKPLQFRKSISYFGQCQRRVKERYYQVRISEVALNDRETAISVICHELIHTLPDVYGHSKEFKKYSQIVKDLFGIEVSTRVTESQEKFCNVEDEKIKRAKYKISCLDCGFYFFLSRKSNLTLHPERYLCPRCCGHLKVVTL